MENPGPYEICAVASLDSQFCHYSHEWRKPNIFLIEFGRGALMLVLMTSSSLRDVVH